MTRVAKRSALVAGIAAILLAFGAAAPAAAWGGPTNFAGGNCSKYSIPVNSAGNAGASTALLAGAQGVAVGFRGGGHYWIERRTGTGTAISFISQMVVNTYNVAGGTHTCNGTTANSYS